jgi:hypothetical protein
MQFKDLKINDKIQIFHSDNTVEIETIKNISSHNGMIRMTFNTTDLAVKALPNESIYFDEDNDIVLFTTKHKLVNH